MEDPEFYQDKKWRVSKSGYDQYGGACTPPSAKTPGFHRSFSQKRPKGASASSTSLSKSSSVRINHHASPPTGLRRSASTRHCSPTEDSGGIRKKGSAFTKKCSAMAKEQKARFYIMKRCVAMLVRWRKHGDS